MLLALEATAESSLKAWASSRKGDKWWGIVVGIGLYALVGLVFGLALKFGNSNLVTLNALWQASNLCVVTLIGVVFFHERLSVAQWVGVVLALAASICFFW